MTRLLLGFALLSAAAGSAFADDARVRSSASVEVLDDKAQIDDVISRLRTPPASDTSAHATAVDHALKQERPPAPGTAADSSHRTVGPEPKEQRPGSRRPNRERNGNPEHTERVRPRRR